ncbi:DUF4124 domain-containing protein [Jeongeupia chitinilytica]|uniref:DUF4124 domain-containing protein n=1 Tax=Jeongeupia chitinilytica TaxID=1041641 RepID=A0ABQ3H1A2_9NEIS|nr:DUF4124 domain-containing protein [Jeongeupia chitinilytica]GHD61385.1 hypothetical protein GCM10007350_15660 [Jeongeupia chitinilytica]
MKPHYLLLAALLVPLFARADIYKYVDENGHVTFTNTPMKGAQRIYVDSISVIPGPTTTTGSKPRTKSSTPRVNTPSPADFPKVDAATQKSRDSNRKQILQDELGSERSALASARQALADAEGNRSAEEKANPQRYVERLGRLRDAVVTHEKNVEALTSELNRVR